MSPPLVDVGCTVCTIPSWFFGQADRDMTRSLGTLHNPSVASALDRLEEDADATARRMAAACRDEIAEYATVRDPAFVQEVLSHAVEHVHAFIRAGRMGSPPAGAELDFVRERGAQRARELMPLDALLEAYLIGQREVWEAVVGAAGTTPEGMRTAQALTALTFSYTHVISVAVADAYLEESNALASEAERGRRNLLDHLLSGYQPGAEEERRSEALGLRPHGDHVVIAAVAVGDETDEATSLIARTLTRAEPAQPFVVVRQAEVIAVLPVYVRRGPRDLKAALERRAEVLERSHDVRLRAGVSSVCGGLGELARGYGEAHRALPHAGIDGGVAALDEIPLLDYLAAAADETAQRLVPAGAEVLLKRDRTGALAATIRAYADCDLNVRRTAERLIVHPNTVHHRLRRIHELTDRDPRRFSDLEELTAALRLLGRDRLSSGAAPLREPPARS
jgi:sugar diacid utilization regulator